MLFEHAPTARCCLNTLISPKEGCYLLLGEHASFPKSRVLFEHAGFHTGRVLFERAAFLKSRVLFKHTGFSNSRAI